MIKTVKIYGAGSIGNHLAHASRQIGLDVMICDVDPGALERTRNDIYPTRYGEWDTSIELVDNSGAPAGGFDLIAIGTPPHRHLELAMSALKERPKAVLIEKPLATPDLEGLYTVTLGVSDFIGPGTPATVEITATTAEEFAEIMILDAASDVLVLAEGDVTNSGNQTALVAFLGVATLKIQDGQLGQAEIQLRNSIERTDGCACRGAVDGNGPGRDWITICAEQQPVFDALVEALLAISADAIDPCQL